MRTLILAPFDHDQLERLRARMDVTYESWLDTRRLADPDELARRIRTEAIAFLVVEADFVFRETFEEAPNLRFVGICRAALNQVEVEAATQHGVVVVNTPGRNAQAVAEHALGLIFALARRIPQAHEYVRSGAWDHPVGGYVDLRGIELGGRALGIIGLGAIGRSLSGIAQGIGMRVIAYDPFVSGPDAGVAMVDLDTIARESDFISVHVPTTPQTVGMLDSGFFSAMKSTAFLVSCSDAEVADQVAVADALRSRRISGAAFDVFETQPISPDSPLLALDNVVLTPHVGGATEETVRRHSQMMADDIVRFTRGARPVNLVNPDAWQPHVR